VEQTVRTKELQLVVFQLANETYGVDIAQVSEIRELQKITRVPRCPEFIEGIINLRGRIIPVVDLRTRFGLPAEEWTANTRIVVVEIGGNTIGVIVDAVLEVLNIHSEAIEPPPPVIANLDSDFLFGVAKLDQRLIILLDLDRVLSRTEKKVLMEGDFKDGAMDKAV
jgi:purine-binding chemotaxis protein CheW